MQDIFFGGWQTLLRTVLVGPAAYAALVILLRVSGKRTLTKLNAFDLVVTVALGSTLATTFLSKDVSVAQGALAFLLLVVLQFAVTWLSVRSRGFHSLVTAEPKLLCLRGQMLTEALRRERVTVEEVNAAARRAGLSSVADIGAVVLESDGSVSVLKAGSEPDRLSTTGSDTTLRDVRVQGDAAAAPGSIHPPGS